MKHRFCRAILLMAISIHVVAEMAWAQAPAAMPTEENTWLKWAISAGLVVAVCLPAFFNAKRSHMS